MSPLSLEYGRTDRLNWARMARAAAVVVLCVVVTGASAFGIYRWWYFRELRAVEHGLRNIEGINYAIYGHDSGEDFTYIIDAVEISVGGDPRRQIVLFGVGPQHFEGTDRFSIHRFGDLTFEWTSFERVTPNSQHPDGWRASAGSTGLEIGPGSQFASILQLPREVTTVQDLVTHYDELQDAMEQWPPTGAVPFSAQVELRYCIRRPERAGPATPSPPPPRKP